jgi:hypothetical protein
MARWLSIVAVISIAACRNANEKVVVRSNVILQLDEIRHSGPNASGRDVSLRLTLINASSVESVRVNGRGVLAGRQSPEMIRDIWLDVIHEPTGDRIGFDCRLRGGAATADDYITLRPQRSLSFVHDLHCFRMERPGKYLVSAWIDVAVPSAMVQPGVTPMAVPASSNQIGIVISPAQPIK